MICLFDLFFVLFCYLYSIECVCRTCRIQYDGMSLRCLLCLLHNNVASLWRTFVPTELVTLYLLGLKNRHGQGLCWMSTGRSNGLMRRTHTHTRHTSMHFFFTPFPLVVPLKQEEQERQTTNGEIFPGTRYGNTRRVGKGSALRNWPVPVRCRYPKGPTFRHDTAVFSFENGDMYEILLYPADAIYRI